MNRPTPHASLALLTLVVVSTTAASATAQTPYEPEDPSAINAVLGDESWEVRHGDRSFESATEVERIQTHLFYVIDLLEDAPTPHLSKVQRRNRAALLDELEDYAHRGIFPARQLGDGYGARRPRFIDHRGVHCAVGELIKRSGHGALAQEINASHEFSYIFDIENPSLLDWASTSGFTTRELAMIQPGYSSFHANSQSTLRALKTHTDHVTLMCGREHRIPAKLPVVIYAGDDVEPVKINEHMFKPTITMKLAGKKKSAFGACFVDRFNTDGYLSGRAMRMSADTFTMKRTLDLKKADELITDRVRAVSFDATRTSCFPRPGALSKTARITLRSNRERMKISVVTAPRNEEIDACLEAHLNKHLADIGPGQWDVEAKVKRELQPLFNERYLEGLARSTGGAAATRCHDKGAPKEVSIRIETSVEDQSAEVRVEGGSDAFRACVQKELGGYLERQAVSRKLPDGTYQRYRFVDSTTVVKASFRIQTPEEVERQRRERQKQYDHMLEEP